MGLDADIALFCAKLDAAIDKAMQGVVAETTKATMAEVIETEVYAKYDSRAGDPYIRRRTNGGLQDPENMEARYDGADKTLTVENVTMDNKYSLESGNRRVAPVVESGEGYTWTSSKMYKHPIARPFHKKTEEQMGNGLFEQALDWSLRTESGLDAQIV